MRLFLRRLVHAESDGERIWYLLAAMPVKILARVFEYGWYPVVEDVAFLSPQTGFPSSTVFWTDAADSHLRTFRSYVVSIPVPFLVISTMCGPSNS